MKNRKRMIEFVLIFLLATSLLTLSGVEAQNPNVVGHWSLDEVKSSGYSVITPDETGINNGIVAGDPQPVIVDGKFDMAFQFNGDNMVYVPIKFVVGFPPMPQPMYVPISPGLDIQKYIQIDAWIKVSDFKNATYNNIVVKCNHPDQACAWQNTTRVLGLALRAGTSPVGEDYVQGALSGYLLTEDGANEIVTTESIPLNQWINVEFSRTSTGMHLYLNGHEQAVKILQGSQNPQGNIQDGTEYYFGHDSLATIDDVKIVDLSTLGTVENSFDIGPNAMIVIVAVSIIFAVAWLLRRAIQLWIIRPKP